MVCEAKGIIRSLAAKARDDLVALIQINL